MSCCPLVRRSTSRYFAPQRMGAEGGGGLPTRAGQTYTQRLPAATMNTMVHLCRRDILRGHRGSWSLSQATSKEILSAAFLPTLSGLPARTIVCWRSCSRPSSCSGRASPGKVVASCSGATPVSANIVMPAAADPHKLEARGAGKKDKWAWGTCHATPNRVLG